MHNYVFTKNSSLERPRNVDKDTFTSASYGDTFQYNPNDIPLRLYPFHDSLTSSQEYNIIRSLKNIINRHNATDDLYNFSNFYNKPTALMAFNSAHLGSGIQKGSVVLNMYLTGTLLSSCADNRENGILYDNNDNKIGIVLYNEGFILLNNTSSLSTEQYTFSNGIDGILDNVRWNYFCSNGDDEVFCDIEYLTRNDVPHNTYFVFAEKNKLNHSNNQTYIESSSYYGQTNQAFFKEDETMKVKKTNKSPFVSGSAEFHKQTFITNIGLYDKDKNLIAVASLANPVKKTENREFLFKLRVDF